MNPGRVLFICWRDLRYTLKEKSTLLWLFVMPLVFTYFIGVATGGFGGGRGERPDNIAVSIPADAGYLAERAVRRLQENNFAVVRFNGERERLSDGDASYDRYARRLALPAAMTASIAAGVAVEANYTSSIESVAREYDEFRVQRALYTVLADVITAARTASGFGEAGLAIIDAAPRQLVLSVRPAGKRKTPPSGFAQTVPGIMVMFTLLVLLTSGAVLVLNERKQGLLRRLAATPIVRAELVAGKWLGKAVLGFIQVGFAMLAGSLLFGMNWGPNLAMVLGVLLLWVLFCAGLGLWIGSVGKSEGQVTGIGVLSANVLAGLGGCWWPIEVAPDWMQSLQKALPTGWVMDALHRLISFQSAAAEVVPHLMALALGCLVLGWVSVKYFRYS